MATQAAPNKRREAVEEAHRANAGARGPDGRLMFPGLREDPERRKRWAWLIEEGVDYDGEYDYSQTDADLLREHKLPSENYRRPDWRRWQLEVMLDNQHARNERLRVDPTLFNEGGDGVPQGFITESTTSTPDIAAFPTWTPALIRRLWPRNYFQDLIPSLAMSQPTGRVFTVDHTFGSSGETYAAGTRVDNVEDMDYSDSNGECATINELDFQITGADVTTITKKILSKYSLEAQQDVEAYFGIALDPELAMAQAKLLAREKNRYIIEQLRTGGTAGPASFDKTVTTVNGFDYTQIDPKIYARLIFDAILDVDMDIFDAGFFESTQLVFDTRTKNYLEELNSYALTKVDGRGTGRIVTTPNLFGQLDGRWDSYADPFLVENQIVVIARGPSYIETPALHLSYVPFFSLPPFLNPETQCVSRSAMERFGFLFTKPELVGRVDVTD